MHLYQDRPVAPDSVESYLNHMSGGTPFAVIRLGGYARLHLNSAADCDALIAAAVEAKQLLAPPTSPLTAALCECSHGGTVHAGSAPYRCLHKGCGCERFRPAASAGPGGVLVGPFDDDDEPALATS